MQITIYLDGSFESLAAKTLSPAEKKAKIKELQADLKTIKKVEALRVTREAAKKAGNKVKDKELLAKIKALKTTLSSNRNSSTAIVSKFIKAVMDMPTGTSKTIAQIDKESKKPLFTPKEAANIKKTNEVFQATNLKIQDMRLQKAFEQASQDFKSAAPRTEEWKAHRAKVQKIKELMAESKEGVLHSKADLSAVAPSERKPAAKKAVRAQDPVHDKIRPGDKVAKAEMREMEQLMQDLPEAQKNYRRMPKSEPMQKSRENAKRQLDALKKRLDMLKKKYID